MNTLKSRQTALVNQKPRVPIVSTIRQTTSTSLRTQRRETKYSLTSLAVAKSSNQSNSSSSNKTTFIKPSVIPVRSRSTVSSSVMPSGDGNGKCQYCDKFFAKKHGLLTHLEEKCEKIPPSARRQLLQKEKHVVEANSKPNARKIRQDIDSVSKYSRFFLNITNEGASGVAAIDVENGLKNLRAELRKTKGPHIGIARTPSKAIRCHICKKAFLDPIEYADHSTKHPLN